MRAGMGAERGSMRWRRLCCHPRHFSFNCFFDSGFRQPFFKSSRTSETPVNGQLPCPSAWLVLLRKVWQPQTACISMRTDKKFPYAWAFSIFLPDTALALSLAMCASPYSIEIAWGTSGQMSGDRIEVARYCFKVASQPSCKVLVNP